MKIVHIVEIIESERGWGQNVDETIYFASKEKAEAYCNKYNARNTATTAPDWYMVALYKGKESIPEDKEIR